ncbi:DUF4105 domain-containing protein [Aureimonas sp. SK2]|uniref:Lnb N-terminal periplasmic domain-containing protein n=1 Tax=Aureimonas sp. SK2 TaxID=3015992 RepID=UPI002445175F|nr:DUF4105 domain-containing protein [Aureimonas sp. SK2]
MSLWFHAGESISGRTAAVVFWVFVLFAAGWLSTRRPRLGIALLALLAVGFSGWWWSIKPRLDRSWAPDVARTVTGSATGDVVTLLNVRDFRWTSESEADERWDWRKYDLSKLVETDLVLSYWGIDAIAHTLVSFGFSDGRRVVFSVEIRRERDEVFSSIAGFFKVYELALIASEESDILYLRTNMRGEDTYLYPLALPPEAMRALFLRYVETGNKLAREPAFYNTLTANCTTVIFDLAQLIEPGLPTDWRILLSGYLPGYLIDQNVLVSKLPEPELRRQAAISALARAAPNDAPYSNVIRGSPK